ncbi:MAG: RNA methyltransferase [Patescibacteria group bacterium]
MLTREQEKVIRSLSTKKGRDSSGLCLVEGKKVIETAGSAVVYTFGPNDTTRFFQLVTTETPQARAGVARIPQWSIRDVASRDVVVVLDGVQDPGNVGAILRLCLGYGAGLVLVESADITNPKVVRASVGSLFQVPWVRVRREGAAEALAAFDRPIYRLEKKAGAKIFDAHKIKTPCLFIAGSEGAGIQLEIIGESIAIPHNDALESLNIGHALAIILYSISDANRSSDTNE